MDEDVKNDIAVAGRLGIAATTLEGCLLRRDTGTPGHAGLLLGSLFDVGLYDHLYECENIDELNELGHALLEVRDKGRTGNLWKPLLSWETTQGA